VNRLLNVTRGRVQRWLLPAWLCLLLAAVTAIGVSAWLGDGSAGGASLGAEEQARAQSMLTGLGLPDSMGTGSEVASSRDRDVEPSKPEETPSPHDFIWPVDGYIVQGMWAGHPSGIDIGAMTGDPVRAVRDGTVIFAGGDPCCGYGNFIIVEHDDGWSSLYGHLSAFAVGLGDEVDQNQRIGSIGATGKADGPHLHFELRSYGGVVNPLDYLWPHRSAPPPPPYVAGAPAQSASEAPEPPASEPESSGVAISAGEAISAALPWLAGEANAAYELDAGSCSAISSGPNWIVTCRALLQGCLDPTVCASIVTACVLSQPVLVASSC